MRVGLFIPCYVDALYPHVGVATYKLLKKLKVDVVYPERQTCCGQPMANGGFQRMSDHLAERFEDKFKDFDYVFCWLGNTNLILSIIKLMEDKMNIDNDIHEVGVQMILLVEDSIRFYSSILPNLYSYILTQSQNFATEALTRHEASLRQRGRPKVVLARTYEEAWEIYQRYKDNCLGVISDVRFPINNVEDKGSSATEGNIPVAEKDPEAGLKLLRAIRKEDEYLPLIIESSESEKGGQQQAESPE